MVVGAAARAVSDGCLFLSWGERASNRGGKGHASARHRSHLVSRRAGEADEFVAQSFGLTPADPFYGRQNALRTQTGEVLAEIIEILAPANG